MDGVDSGLYVGLMSGTSMDSIDAALVDFSGPSPSLLATDSYPLPDPLRRELAALCLPGDNELDRAGVADRQLGRLFAAATHRLLDRSKIGSHRVRAIGCHGQTVRHRPHLGENCFTLQLGDPNTVAQLTGITTVADFRRRDIAAGGQGAPLAPAFHRAVFGSATHNRAVVNIGGIANVTLLTPEGDTLGFDTGPGNTLMDAWIERHRGQSYDTGGAWAATGRVRDDLLQRLLRHPYLSAAVPKSTGREEFNLPWLDSVLQGADYAAVDVQATLLEFTAQTIAGAIVDLPEPVSEVFVCGGGAFNTRLMLRLETLLHPHPLAATDTLGINPEWVEAAAFAWLAKRTLEGLPGNLPSVTGAAGDVILGAIYQA